MEHSERGAYVTEQVELWICNDSGHYERARDIARMQPVDALARYLTHQLKFGIAYSAPWQCGQELAANDYQRIDWNAIAKSLIGE